MDGTQVLELHKMALEAHKVDGVLVHYMEAVPHGKMALEFHKLWDNLVSQMDGMKGRLLNGVAWEQALL